MRLALVLLAACGGSRPPVSPVLVEFRGGPAEAVVFVDDRRVGSLEEVTARGVKVSPGVHRVSVEAPGYLQWDREVTTETSTLRIEVRLGPVPD
ncbi:MAG: PEGA domain-containing protein [Myxococcales bacterium]